MKAECCEIGRSAAKTVGQASTCRAVTLRRRRLFPYSSVLSAQSAVKIREPANIKITKRTHFQIFDLPVNKADLAPSVLNLRQKRTHLTSCFNQSREVRQNRTVIPPLAAPFVASSTLYDLKPWGEWHPATAGPVRTEK